MRKMLITAPLLFAHIIAAEAIAATCPTPSPTLISSADELIDRTKRIVIAQSLPFSEAEPESESDRPIPLDRERDMKKATEGERYPERVVARRKLARFGVVENISGNGPEIIYLASSDATDAGDGDYDGHRADQFWTDEHAGRAAIAVDCQLDVSFVHGSKYLIFVGPPHVKAYERVAVDDDKWVEYVRARISGSR